ncbi:signal peptide peptidase SppA [Nitrospira moscoviensis]|uniref:Putative Signal peptide peptidase SppA n=1 Tax=Nitrospira moscoviensis TaxID=42253 RepID=A0A0K2GFI8_NITMO|nr:signal peptide peptidase SppA [Nitrospira moscoviensis]ALA59716.1 putative Signal peptide peptidase SppA [Nitrospira moscoviensis]
MRSRSALVLSAVLSITGCTFNFSLFPGPGPLQETQVSGTGKAKVLLMEVSGVISSQEGDGFVPTPSMIANIKEQLSRAAQDDAVKALVLRINTPGGTVTASDIIHHEVKAFKSNRKVPVVASIMDVGASGGYYIAAAADSVLAHPSSVTGSIGVIMLTMNAKGLLEKVGVEATAVASGPRKDMGSPFRAMTPEERSIFQGLIDSFYQRFLSVVQEGRPNLQMDQIKKLADGRIYTGDQAKAAGLVDDIGYLEDAVELAKKKAGVTEARVVMYRRPGEYSNNVYSKLMAPSPLAALGNFDLMAFVRSGAPQFMYLWMP